MQAVHDNSFQSLVKACILSEVKGYEPVHEANLKSNEYKNANDYQLNQLFIEWDWVNGTPHNINRLENAVKLALKHKYANHSLIFKIIAQALKHGVDYVLTRSSFEAKRFCNLVLAVRDELRQAKLNIKFTHEGNTLLGKYLFSHEIADLLLEFYQKRFPSKQVVIVNHHQAFTLEDDKLKMMPVMTAPIVMPVGVKNQLMVNLHSFL